MSWFTTNAPAGVDLEAETPTLNTYAETQASFANGVRQPTSGGSAPPATNYEQYPMPPGWNTPGVGHSAVMHRWPDGTYHSYPPPSGWGTGAPTTPDPPAQGAGQAPPGGYTEQWFTSTIGRPTTSAELQALAPKLAQYGIKIAPSASGVIGDIQLPNGQIVDVIQGAATGGHGFGWIPDQPGGGAGGGYGTQGAGAYTAGTYTGGGQYPLSSYMASNGLNTPWTTPFQAPTELSYKNDPGYLERMKLGTQAIERSAAAKGTLLTGGTLKDLTTFASDYGSSEYDKVYGRAKGEYDTAYNIYNQNQNNLWGRLSGMAGTGLTAASQYGQNATGYGTNMANNIAAGTNATAGAQMAGGNAGANAIAGTTNTLGNLVNQWWADRQSKTTQPSTTGGGGSTGGGYVYDPFYGDYQQH